jgi:hypothetical protein
MAGQAPRCCQMGRQSPISVGRPGAFTFGVGRPYTIRASGRATRLDIVGRLAPKGEASEDPPDRSGQRPAARRGQAKIVIRLIEERHRDACQAGALDCELQVGLGRQAQHDQVARLSRPAKPPPGLDTGVPYLDDLLRQRDVAPYQDVGV